MPTPSVVGSVDPATVARLGALVAHAGTSDRLVRLLEAHGWRLHDVIGMDEFTLDWVIGADEVWLVFDTT